MYRVLTAAICVIALCFSLCACNKNDNVVEDASQAVSEVASDVASDVKDMGEMDNGKVTDSDGFIDEDDDRNDNESDSNSETRSENETEEETDTFM